LQDEQIMAIAQHREAKAMHIIHQTDGFIGRSLRSQYMDQLNKAKNFAKNTANLKKMWESVQEADDAARSAQTQLKGKRTNMCGVEGESKW
jgi:hypothetical protein